jgi:hypothetical protein
LHYNENPGANPTIISYNTSAVKIYNAKSNQEHFESKNMFFYFEQRTSLLQRWRQRCKFLQLEVS